MTFLTPLFLLALGAISVPILLHLLRRRERRTFVFPALRYLKRTTREHARIVRLRQLLLLAIRTAAVLAAVLAGARLVLPVGGADDPPAALALVVDNGLTSAAVVGEDRVLDSLRSRAHQVLDRTGPRDQIWVIPAGAPWEAVVPMSPDAARAELEELAPTHVTSDLTAVLSRAESLVSASELEVREVVLLSDLRSESVPVGERLPAAGGPTVRIAPPPPVPTANQGIAELQISGGVTPRTGDLAELQIRVVGSAAEGSTVRAYVEDGLVGSATVGPGGLAAVPLPRMGSGWIRGRVELEPDDLRADDVAHFTFRATPPPAVDVLGEAPSYVEESLSVLADAGRIQLVGEDDADIRIVFPPTTGPIVAGPGSILVPPEDPSLLPALNRIVDGLLPGWTVEAQSGVSSGTELRITAGALIEFLPGRPDVRIAHSIHAPDREAGTVELLTLSDGRPWAVEIETDGDRPVIVLASPLTAEASDLPTSAAMVPLMELLTGRLSDGVTGGSVRAGDPIPVPVAATTAHAPDGSRRALGGSATFAETRFAGIYAFTGPEGDTLSLSAVNPLPPGPGYSLDAPTAAARLRSVWPDLEVAEPWPASILRERRGREVARPLLAVLFLLLLTESWLATAQDRGTRGGRNGADASALSGARASEAGAYAPDRNE